MIRVIQVFMWILSLGLLYWVDWRIAVGVFFALWANNMKDAQDIYNV